MPQQMNSADPLSGTAHTTSETACNSPSVYLSRSAITRDTTMLDSQGLATFRSHDNRVAKVVHECARIKHAFASSPYSSQKSASSTPGVSLIFSILTLRTDIIEDSLAGSENEHRKRRVLGCWASELALAALSSA